MELAPKYWDLMDQLARNGRIFCTMEVKREIRKKDDGLRDWFKDREYFFREVTDEINKTVREIVAAHPQIVDSTKGRSTADPFVIAHAKVEGSVVVTKEQSARRKIRIPDVCRAIDVACIDDHRFIREVGIRFEATFRD